MSISLPDSSKLREALGGSSGTRLRALRVLVSHVNNGLDVSPAVLASALSGSKSDPNESRRLVAVLLEQYSARYQDQALLPISSLQADIRCSPKPRDVAFAIMCLASVRVGALVPVVHMSIESCSRQSSAWVRKATAHALLHLRCDQERAAAIARFGDLGLIAALLADHCVGVVESAVYLASTVALPELIGLLHSCFRRLCHVLFDMVSPAQAIALSLLTCYGRSQFTRMESATADGDLGLLLRCAARLMHSPSSAVVLAACELWFALGPQEKAASLSSLNLPWRLDGVSNEHDYLLVRGLETMVRRCPAAFEDSIDFFLCQPSEPLYLRSAKLDVLCVLASKRSLRRIVKQLSLYTSDPDLEFACLAIRCFATIGVRSDGAADLCVTTLMQIWDRRNSCVVLQAECALALRRLLKVWRGDRIAVLKRLAMSLDRLSDTDSVEAQKEIVWLIGVYSSELMLIAPDVLRKLARRFCTLSRPVKLQVLTLAAKLGLSDPQHCIELSRYVLELGKFDADYDVRDRVRFLSAAIDGHETVDPSFLSCVKETLLSHEFSEEKQGVHPMEPSTSASSNERFRVGTLSHLVGNSVEGYISLPNFPERSSDDTIRDLPIVEGMSQDAAPIHHDVERRSSQAEVTSKNNEGDSDWDSSDEDVQTRASPYALQTSPHGEPPLDIDDEGDSSGIEEFDALGF